MAAMMLAGPTHAVLTDGLVSYWKLDDGSGSVATDSAGSNNGTITGATWTTGKIGGALNFNGDDYVDTESPFQSTLRGSFTIAFWVKPTAAR